jgi:hypothetical protein
MQDIPESIPVQESPDLPPPISGQPKKSNKTWIIILIVVIVLCCLCSCVASGIWLWNNGDSLMEQYTTTSMLLSLI